MPVLGRRRPPRYSAGMQTLPRLALAALILMMAGCNAPSAGTDILCEPIAALDPGQPERTRFGALEFRGGLRLSSAERHFGGWSGARLEGDQLTLVNDVGGWLRLRLQQQAGRLTGVHREAGGRLLSTRGEPVGDRKVLSDSEGLVRWRDGYVVSFERRHRLWHYRPGLEARPAALAGPAAMAELPDNGGIEAVTDLSDGRLLLLAEEGGVGWVGTPEAWQELRWPVSDFKPTDAALLPDGSVVVLERRFNLAGPGTRLTLLAPGAVTPGALLQGRELLFLEKPMRMDNFEGLAVGRGPAGEVMLYLISDDNFSALQETLLLAFALVPPEAGR